MADALDRFKQVAEAISINFLGELETEAAPLALYHYTHKGGLEGILSSGSLWVCDIFTMDDRLELKHGLIQAVEILRGMAESAPCETQWLSGRFVALLSDEVIKATAHYFTCSLSLAGNDLNQWITYAESGRGFALEFDGPLLEEIYTKDPYGSPIKNNCTFPVAYDDAKLRDMLGQIIESALPLISAPHQCGLSSGQNCSYLSELWLAIALNSLRCSLFFKGEGFDKEQEYRLLQIFRGDQAEPPVKLKPGSGFRYREFDWKSRRLSALRRITVGPTADVGAEDFVRQLLSAGGFSGVAVDRSNLP